MAISSSKLTPTQTSITHVTSQCDGSVVILEGELSHGLQEETFSP